MFTSALTRTLQESIEIMSHNTTFETVSSNQLMGVSGGGFGWLKPITKIGRAASAANGVLSGFNAGNTYFDARNHGKGVKGSLWAGLKKLV